MKKILIVEDEQNILNNLKFLLEANDYEVYTAANGLEGYKEAIMIIPDLIVSDILMPEMDGYSFKQKLNSNEKTAGIPFIFLTAKVEMQDLRQGMNSGADDYLIKPFKTQELLKAIETRLKRVVDFEKRVEVKNINKNKLDHEGRILIELKNKQEFVKVNGIKYIRSEGAYSEIFISSNKKYLIRKLLKEWEKILPGNTFLRIHRSLIINVEHVVKIEKIFNRTYKAYLTECAEPFDISQRFAVKLKDKLAV